VGVNLGEYSSIYKSGVVLVVQPSRQWTSGEAHRRGKDLFTGQRDLNYLARVHTAEKTPARLDAQRGLKQHSGDRDGRKSVQSKYKFGEWWGAGFLGGHKNHPKKRGLWISDVPDSAGQMGKRGKKKKQKKRGSRVHSLGMPMMREVPKMIELIVMRMT